MAVSEGPLARASDAAPSAHGGAGEGIVDGRYRVLATLGRGGMAVVYDVLDAATGERRALKRLTAPEAPEKRMDAVALFEREFFTLAQLRHPRIVSVHDYGVDADGPYYTMELLDGGDLQRKAPVPWREACAIGRDVCSALSLVHSRRMVYRDLSPRNVRCTGDGLAKLIDFGAMGPMGPSKELIGTLPCCAPETVDLQPLDARTDLYALGATLYYTLVGRHAHPARDFHQLIEMWRGRPRRPSESVPDVPVALDGLVLDLMNPDPGVRPASAAEVMERLAAIAGLPSDEQLLVSQAYLSTPTLVGRDVELGNIRKLVARAKRRRGASVLIRGPAGVGRTRLLDALVLEGKLAGAVVLRADASDAAAGPYGVTRAVASQLLRLLPEVAVRAAEPYRTVLGHIVPELAGDGVVLQAFEDSRHLSRRLQPAMRQWIADVGRRRSLIVAVDDLQRVDEASAALFAILASEISQRSVLLATTLDSSVIAPPHLAPTLKVLADASTSLELAALEAPHAEQLLGSIFGEQPNLARLSHRLFSITRGNPRDSMRLAQHLVDERVLRYEAGAWILPEAIERIELPSSMADALRHRIETLEPDARKLAVAMAFAAGERFTFDECLLVTDHRSRARLAQSIDELVAREVVVDEGGAYHLGRQGFDAALRRGATEDAGRDAHLGLARLFGRRGDGLNEGRHLLQSGQEGRGLDVFVAFCRRSVDETNASSEAFIQLFQSLPDDWFRWFETSLRLAAERQRPAKDLYAIRSRLSGLVAMVGAGATPHMNAFVADLHRECGLALYESLGPSENAGERLGKAMAATWQRYSELPESERVVDPTTALTGLARALIQTIGLLAISCDYAEWRKLPSLRPFAPISPALAVIDQLVEGVGARIAGRIESCLEIYRRIIERLSMQDRAGLDDSHHRHMRLRVLAGMCTLQATMGSTPDAAALAELDADAFYEPSAALIRMVGHVWQGDVKEADRCKKHVELLQIQTSASRILSDGTHLISELVAYALMNDLTRVKRTLDAIEAMAKEYPAWAPVLAYGRGEYHRIRGDHASALDELDASLALMEPGLGRAWPHAAGARLMALFELGRLEEAKASAEHYTSVADAADVGYAKAYVEMPHALVLAKLGELERAVATADRIISAFEALGIGGLNLATAHEVRARVALDAQDQRTFEKHVALASQRRHGGRHGLEGARYARLAQPVGSVDVIGALHDQVSALSRFTSVLVSCKSSGERAQRGLDMLVRSSGAAGGALYVLRSSGIERCACSGRLEPDPKMDELVNDYMEREMHEDDETRILDDVTAITSFTREWKGAGTGRYVPVLLSHQLEEGLAISGVAVLMVDGDCRLTYPAAIASELSRLCHDAGDVMAQIV
ncbi:MAG TPA: AAA family ATPase [Polyangiaceae bacterium]|nr:AAA family ATPase [Polyangiaceae bacterium]